MAYARGRYGIEYTPRPAPSREHHHLGWLLLGVAVLVAVSYFFTRRERIPGPPPLQPPPDAPMERPATLPSVPAQSAPPIVETKPASTATPPIKNTPHRQEHRAQRPAAGMTPFAAKVDGWIASRTWPKNEQELLTLLRDAEQRGNLMGARGAIDNLMYRPTVEDIKDQLIRRLGELNTQLLFSGTNTPWTATVSVKRGDTLQRIATEHRTTLEALQKLNPLKDPNRLALGQKLRVLNFPDADLVIHKQLQFAELLLKKRIFKRYYVTIRADAATGAYQVSNESGSRASDHLRALFEKIAPADRDELRLFLAPGSRITVTAQ